MTDFNRYHMDVPYSASVVAEDFASSSSYAYPGAIEGGWVEGLSVRVIDKFQREWVGHFSAGEESPNAADFCAPHPDGERLAVVSKGNGYIVLPEDPGQWEEIKFHPIIGCGLDSVTGTLFFYDYTKVFGIGAKGRSWKTASLSWDGLRNVKLSDGKITGDGWNAPDGAWVPFEIDLVDGRCSGGAAPNR